MITFSASDAALEGFHLIRRRWRVVLGWAGFNLLALLMLAVLTAVLGVAAGATAGQPKAPAIVAGLVIGLGTLALEAILAGGVFRLELRPEQPAFLHLRLGADELRLVVVVLITMTGAWALGWLAGLAGHAVHLGPAGVFVGLMIYLYFGVRFSLAAPVSFAERRIDFVRSWRLTRGRFWPLFGMGALSACLIALVMIVVLIVLAVLAAGIGGFEALSGLFGGADALKQHPGVYALEFAVQIVLTPVLWILGLAPVIAAYRVFTDGVDGADAVDAAAPAPAPAVD